MTPAPIDTAFVSVALVIIGFCAGASWGMLRGDRSSRQIGALWALDWLSGRNWLRGSPGRIGVPMLRDFAKHERKLAGGPPDGC